MTIILFECNQYLKYNAGKKYLAISKKFTSEKLNAHKIIMIFLSKQTKKKKIKKTIREVSFEVKGTSNG